jgi:Heparinase II/III-like protein
MLSADSIGSRRAEIERSPDLSALLERLTARAERIIARPPEIPADKALLSADGGVCPEHGTPLEFDPWSPGEHRCAACGRAYRGSRHDRAWARWQHLWLAERAAELATVAALADRDDAADAAARILSAYAGRYADYPNLDNVLGPSRLFFSTYLESIWLTGYLGAAMLLRDSGRLDSVLADAVSGVADEAANLIGEFDEGFSNRQTWHNAALAAVAVWFEDEELATRVVEGPTGIIAHLVRGFGDDGMWYEGENYHLFALRGELLAMSWAREAGVDFTADPRLAGRLAGALRAPALSALPDRTFPARKDSRYGVSLAQPMYLELWEAGLARIGSAGGDLWAWLDALYHAPAPPAERFDSYLHETGQPAPGAPRSRADLSWWALLEMAPELPAAAGGWSPGDTLLEQQGLAILRRGDRYASIECGAYGGGHGHPDRLQLTLHAAGHHWMPDPGTGSYVSPDLFWYRSTLAHNAPRIDGRSQRPADAECVAFDQSGEWAWTRGSVAALTRTLVAGPRYLLDVVALDAADEHRLELPWHLFGEVEVLGKGRWVPDTLESEFVHGVERFEPATAGSLRLRARAGDGVVLTLHLDVAGELLRATGPGLPGSEKEATFLVARAAGRAARITTILEVSRSAEPAVRGLHVEGDLIEVETATGPERHVGVTEGWAITTGDTNLRLKGLRRAPPARAPLFDPDRPAAVQGVAWHAAEPPSLDGSADGFEQGEALALDYEDQYRRSEEPYPGPEEFSAVGSALWDTEALYLSVEVMKPELVLRGDDAPPLRFDNDPDDIHADGVQLYIRPADDAPVYGFLVALGDDGGLRVHGATGTSGKPDMITGRWQRTESGYRITLAVALPGWEPRGGDMVGFDLLVNRMEPGRERRSGQLVWSGGGGWVYLRGDRQESARFGFLELR